MAGNKRCSLYRQTHRGTEPYCRRTEGMVGKKRSAPEEILQHQRSVVQGAEAEGQAARNERRGTDRAPFHQRHAGKKTPHHRGGFRSGGLQGSRMGQIEITA